ncbi:MAG: UvrB domain 3-containing protein, partial [Pseudanabaena sp.]
IDKTKQPKILIVTEKLLTGFDAPILYSLYLDKPMRDHVLLQAIARVNRPYEDKSGQVKPYGFVLDFVGIFEKLSKALAFDKDEIASAIQNIDVLKALFDVYIKDNAQAYLALTKGWDDKAKEQAVEYFNDKDVREKFFKFFKQLQNLYDILSPDAFLRPYIEDYQVLAELYATVRSAYNTNPYIDRELTSKTKELLRQHTDITHLELPNEIKNISAIELEALKTSNSSDVIKVLNLRKLLAVTVQTEGESKPFLLSIGDRADKVNEAYENRQLTTQEALTEYEKLTREAAEAAEQREKLNIDENTFAIYITLRLVTEHLSVNQAQEINMLFLKFPVYS